MFYYICWHKRTKCLVGLYITLLSIFDASYQMGWFYYDCLRLYSQIRILGKHFLKPCSLLIYMQGYADCIYHTVQNSHSYFQNIRFGVFEDQRRTADILKEELFITSNLHHVQKWIIKKGCIDI